MDYVEHKRLDDVFQSHLERVYGDDAGDMRYQSDLWTDPDLIAAGKAYRQASAIRFPVLSSPEYSKYLSV